MLRNIFQIAICHGNLEVPDQPIKSTYLSNKKTCVTNKKIYFNSSDSSDNEIQLVTEPIIKSSETIINRPNENEVLQAFKEQIISLKVITFPLLSRIEQRLCEKFHVIYFHELGHGTFNNYLTQNEQLLFVNDPKFRFSFSEDNNNNNHAKSVVSFEDTEQFLLQAVDRSVDQQYIEQLACYHFQIQSFEQLGHGSFSFSI